MGLEYLMAKRQGKSYFRFNNSVANLNVGIAERFLDTFTTGAFYVVYEYLHRQYALLDIRLFILLTVINFGALLEQRRWVLYLEIGRLEVLWLALYITPGDPLLIVLGYIGSLSIWAYFSFVQKRYFQLVYGAR
ncbi:hypothetical protein GCM10028818_44840 [Spirosoma horti]